MNKSRKVAMKKRRKTRERLKSKERETRGPATQTRRSSGS